MMVVDHPERDAELIVVAIQRVYEAAGRERPAYGHVICPKCQGRLYYALIGPRHHKGECTSPRCLQWIG